MEALEAAKLSSYPIKLESTVGDRSKSRDESQVRVMKFTSDITQIKKAREDNSPQSPIFSQVRNTNPKPVRPKAKSNHRPVDDGLGFDKDFLEFEGDGKEQILFSENPKSFNNKKFEHVDFNRLDKLKFETNKAPELDFLVSDDIFPDKTKLHKKSHHESDDDSDSDSDEFNDSGFDHTDAKKKSTEKDMGSKKLAQPKKHAESDLDDFLNY